jgi:hypothetical protein
LLTDQHAEGIAGFDKDYRGGTSPVLEHDRTVIPEALRILEAPGRPVVRARMKEFSDDLVGAPGKA